MAIPPLISEPEQDTARSLSGNDEVAGSNEISLIDFFIVVAEQKRLVFAITAAFAVLAAVISLVLPARYTATVTLLPPQQNTSLSSMLASQFGGAAGMAALATGGGLALKNPNDMYIGLLKSRTVEDSVIQRFGLMQQYRAKFPTDARTDLENHVKVDGTAKDGLIRISVEDPSAKRAAELANGYVDEFRHLSEHLAITEASRRRLFFEQQLQLAKDSLTQAEEAMKRTEQQTGVIAVDSQARALIESAAEIRAQIAAKQVEIKALETFATDQNAQLIQAQQELTTMRAQLAKLGGSELDSEGGLIVPKGKVPEASLEYARALREIKYRETVFEILARQFELAKLDEAKEGSPVQVVDTAVPPDKRSFPKRVLIVLSALLAGIVVGIFVALVRGVYRNMLSVPSSAYKLHRLVQAFAIHDRRAKES